MEPKHPIQPLVWDVVGDNETDDVIRFKKNKIVRFLLDAGPFDMNQLALMPFDREDREQFAQLIGYSVSGFGELSYADPAIVARMDRIAERMVEKSGTKVKQ